MAAIYVYKFEGKPKRGDYKVCTHHTPGGLWLREETDLHSTFWEWKELIDWIRFENVTDYIHWLDELLGENTE